MLICFTFQTHAGVVFIGLLRHENEIINLLFYYYFHDCIHFQYAVRHSLTSSRRQIIAFSRNERTHPNLVSQASQAREIETFCGLQIGRPCRFLQGLWASFSCPSVTSCLLSFVASFVVFDFLGVSLKLTGF